MRRIKEEREKLGYNLTDFSKKMNIAPNTLHNYEHGNRTPGIDMIVKMADAFDCSIDYLSERTNIRNAAVIDEYVGDDHVKIELNKDYYSKMTPDDVKELLKNLKEVGFDLNKLL